MSKPILKQIDVTNASSYIEQLPHVIWDGKRCIAVYVRQSKEKASTKNAESRKIQIALIDIAWKLLHGDKPMPMTAEEALRTVEKTGNSEALPGIRIYDEKDGVSGQKRIDQRIKLEMLWQDLSNNLLLGIIIAREDRLARDKHGVIGATISEKCEEFNAFILVPGFNGKGTRYYDFTEYQSVINWRKKMEEAASYIQVHVKSMHDAQIEKSLRGGYDGRCLVPGYVVPFYLEQQDQKVVIYEPWAKKMQWVFQRWWELDCSLARLYKEICLLPHLFPDIPDDDEKKYLFKTPLKKVPSGYKPKNPETVRAWLCNVIYCGWWQIGEKSVIPNSHEAIIPKEEFDMGYALLTGHTLDGEPVERLRKQQISRGVPDALLWLRISSPDCTEVTTPYSNGHHCYYYTGRRHITEYRYHYVEVFAFPTQPLDQIVKDRLEDLIHADRNIADEVARYVENEREKKSDDLTSLEDQLKQVNKKIKKVLHRITLFDDDSNEEDFLDDTIITLNDDEEQDEDSPIRALKSTLAELKQDKIAIQKALELRSKKVDYQDLLEFCDKLEWIKAHFEELDIVELRKIIRTLTQKIEVRVVSMHWLQLSIHWIAPIAIRPDISLIWRSNGAAKKWTDEEIAIVKEHFPTCTNARDLVQLLPKRSWKNIRNLAHGVLHIQKNEHGHHDFPSTITWEDYMAANGDMGMIQEALSRSQYGGNKKDTVWYPFWLPAEPAEIGNEVSAYCPTNQDQATVFAS
jgi:hypothetical protein